MFIGGVATEKDLAILQGDLAVYGVRRATTEGSQRGIVAVRFVEQLL
jgi:hypothetical protein